MGPRRNAFVLAATLAITASAPALGAGFSIFEQGSRAMGMAGAFTAQADDPSAMFHNVAGIAFQKERDILVGTTLITNTEAEFAGAGPFPGAGVTAEQEEVIFYPSHAYWVQPINQVLTFGFAFNNPFGLATEWKDEDVFPGRFISHRAALETYDLSSNVGWQVTPSFGLGLGAIVRTSVVELERRAPFVNPFTQTVQDVANVSLESDFETDFGFQAGLLHRYNNSFHWGLSYRSKIETEYEAEAAFTQISTGIPALDQQIALQLPVGREVPVTTGIEFPDAASLGLWFAITPTASAEIDVNWTGWSSFDRLVLDFDDSVDPTGRLDVDRIEDWEDTMHYRVGLRFGERGQWRLGYVLDETPQPDAAVGPLLPDAERNGITIGYGWQGRSMYADLAFMYLTFDERTIDDPAHHDQFFGTYNTTAMLLGVSVGWK